MDIVEELRQDREKGARRLEAEYKAGLMTLARRFCHDEGDAEELVNRTFAAVVSGIDDYLEKSAFFAWMCQIMTNIHTVDVRRMENKIILYPGDVPEVADTSSAERIYEEVDASLLREAVHKLPKESRELLVLHYFLDIPIPKMAKILAVPAGTVKSRLHYARKALAAKLGVAAQKPGGKAVILALLLSGLTALGAATWNFVVSGESQKIATEAGTSRVASRVSSSAMAEDVGHATSDMRQSDTSALQLSTSSNLPQTPSATTPSATDCYRPSATENSSSTTQGVKMNKTTTTRAAAMLAATTLATGAATTANADDYIWNVPEGETETIDAVAVANIGAKDLVKTGRGKLISSDAMASYTGKITVREGAFEIKTTGSLGTDAGGTFIEDGGTLVVNMSDGQERFSNESFTIEGAGDAAYGAAVYQVKSNDRFKLFKYLTLSGDATIYAGTRLGVDGGTLTMNGHTLTLKGVNFQFRDVTYASPIGDLVVEANTAFVRNQNATANATKTLTIRNGGRIGFAEAYTAPSFWTLVVGEGGTIASFPAATAQWNGNVTWNSTTADNITGNISFNGAVTGTGTIKASSGTLAFAKPLGAGLGLGLSGTATATLPTANAYPYTHRGLITCYRSDGWRSGLNDSSRTDNRWGYCAYGPGPQLEREGWWEPRNGKKDLWNARGYLWNREATNVTYSIFCGPVYETWINTGGTLVLKNKNWVFEGDRTARYDNKRDAWGSFSLEVPANSCIGIDIQTVDGGQSNSDDEGGPRTDNDKLKINGVIANDPTGYYFTTNAVSVRETPALPALALADDCALDANGMAMSVAALSGMGQVANVTTLTVSNSWTLPAADAISGHSLVIDGDLDFGDNCAFSVTGMSNLELGSIHTVCTADSITGFTDAEITDGHSKCKLVKTGNRIDLVSIPNVTVLRFR